MRALWKSGSPGGQLMDHANAATVLLVAAALLLALVLTSRC
ncbi:MAG: hypothetical protein ACO262_01115 [Vulcanococcus sp.]